MEPDDKATTTIPPSDAQKFIIKTDRRDKLVRGIEVFILLIVVAFNIFLGVRLNQVIDQNQKDTLVRAAQASQDRDELKGYIKCLVLLRFDVPAEQLTARDGVASALDACAVANSK